MADLFSLKWHWSSYNDSAVKDPYIYRWRVLSFTSFKIWESVLITLMFKLQPLLRWRYYACLDLKWCSCKELLLEQVALGLKTSVDSCPASPHPPDKFPAGLMDLPVSLHLSWNAGSSGNVQLQTWGRLGLSIALSHVGLRHSRSLTADDRSF